MRAEKYNQSVIKTLTTWIDANLNQRLSVDDIASKAGYSKWYLQKLFAQCTNETLASYIRKRKMIACVNDLKNSNIAIIQLAVKYHFDSQQSFTRAFKKNMGCTPYACRKLKLSAEGHALLETSTNPCGVCERYGLCEPTKSLGIKHRIPELQLITTQLV